MSIFFNENRTKYLKKKIKLLVSGNITKLNKKLTFTFGNLFHRNFLHLVKNSVTNIPQWDQTEAEVFDESKFFIKKVW